MHHIVRIGNSYGVRIPKATIEQLGFKKDTNLVFKVTDNGLLISPERHARDGWEQKFNPSKGSSKDLPLISDFPNEFDKDEWKW